ncbi:hypothetical protein BKA62DRAFT_711006 [Auriculariales sp. MPI-PUGE-AT-0066]|nr:hypothetical protein BKA62DRAFT_711006 [Auriculariales sp. MPI-PUGE-AT-0066]
MTARESWTFSLSPSLSFPPLTSMVTLTKDDSPPGYNDRVPVPKPAVDFYIDQNGCTVSFDPAVNSDPTLMAAFIRDKAQTPPTLIVHIKGTHQETEYKHSSHSSRSSESTSVTVSSDGPRNGLTRVVSESLNVIGNVQTHGRRRRSSNSQTTRLDFKIDISKNIGLEPEFFVIADNVAAFRGKTAMELDLNPGGRHRAAESAKANTAALQEGEKDKLRRGEIPWQLRNAGGSLTLDQWCEEYVREHSQIKDFKFSKIIYGWDLNAVEAAIRASISSVLYSGKVSIDFKTPAGNAVHVRPTTPFSKARANTFLRGLLNVSLVWPITYYLYEQQFRTTGACYALKQWVHLPDSVPGDDVVSYVSRIGRPVDPNKLARTPSGISEIRGVREGEWFAVWESTVKNAVSTNLKSADPLADPLGGPNSMAAKLDGYPGTVTAGPIAGPSSSMF